MLHEPAEISFCKDRNLKMKFSDMSKNDVSKSVVKKREHEVRKWRNKVTIITWVNPAVYYVDTTTLACVQTVFPRGNTGEYIITWEYSLYTGYINT
jgi:hypothetical protein